ncbi:UNVERIFIED_CONTAM: hypothetical protein RMT77_009042 [Armadillidium vulgare]
MDRKITFIIIFVIGVCALEISADADEGHFKVPLEVREKNRPQRLVDNSEDPDMRALKEIQDKFFNIVGNSSVGKEFKSFKQLLHLVDSNAGIELGRLMFQGVMIAYGKDNSNELFNEFIDDFQYRISPELADSLIDYKDFLKTVDLRMIPLTIQTLFRKDELGNSLAQMPLGQLVDLVQPEASKYGIDIKAVVNGILGKGDSTFPDIVKKLIDNFDVNSVLKNLTKLNEIEEDDGTKPSEMKRQRKDPALMLFKPYISKLLKENKIDLDPDAVIQVLTPFVAPLLQSFMPSTPGKDGKPQNGNFDFSQILPMLTLLGSQLGGSRGGAKTQEKLSESELSGSNKVEGKIDKMDTITNTLNMVTGLLKMSDNMKKGKIDDTEAGKEQELLQLALSLMGNMGGKGKKEDSISNLINLAAGALDMSNKNGKQSKDPSANPMELLMSVMSMMGNQGDKKSEGDPMGQLLGLASAFMGKKDGKTEGDPMGQLLGLASAFMGKKDGKTEGDQMGQLLGLASAFMGKKDGKSKDDPMGQLLGLASAFMGKKDGKSEDDPMGQLPGLASAFMGKKDDNSDNPMAGLSSLTSAFKDNKKNGKPDLVNMITSVLGGPYGKEIRYWVKIAAAMFGTGKNKTRERKIDQSPEALKARSEERKKRLEEYKQSIKSDPRYLAAKKNVETVLSDLKEIGNETDSEVSEDKDEELEQNISEKEKSKKSVSDEDKFERTKSFPYALEKFVRGMRSNKFVKSKIQQIFSWGRLFISNKFRTKNDFESYLKATLLPYDKNLNVEALTAPFYFSDKHFGQFLEQLTEEQFSQNRFVTTTTGEVLKKLLDEKLNENIMTVINNQISTGISSLGIKDVTFENFPEKLGLLITVLSKNQDLPDGIDKLLHPLQYSLRNMKDWYAERVAKYSSLSQKELQDIFVESLYEEVVVPIRNLWRIRQASKSSKSCLSKEICQFVNNIEEDRVVETIVSQIGSIVLGGFISERENDPAIFIDVVRASIYRGNCEDAFQSTCGKEATKKEEEDFTYEHIEL